MSTNMKIEKDIPLPAKFIKTYVLDRTVVGNMEVGDSVLMEGDKWSIDGALSRYTRDTGWKFKSVEVEVGKTVRFWRVK